ncbi:MAG: hypothetical protein FJX62_12165 [Alphaproteobacteria bacterium]|nr:hypothetical protein [Alphaproteobacteria bacterium]
MKAAAFALALSAACAMAANAAADTSLPTGKGLPVVVHTAVSFIEIVSFNENAGTYKATVDLRLRWEDPRLRRPAGEANDPPKVYRGQPAQARTAEIWVPAVELANQRAKETYSALGLRIFPSGAVEMTRRVSAEFAAPFEVERFPFDRQKLRLEVAMRDEPAGAVRLAFDQSDLDFSRAGAGVALDGWSVGAVALRSDPIAGWYGASHSRVLAALDIARQPGPIVAAIFIPLFASLLIPLLAIWLNRIEDGRFTIETFELINLTVGGLFAVIALNFTVNAAYQPLSAGDNAVTRLFSINYGALGASLLINVLLSRFAVVERLAGRYVQEQLFYVLAWAVPAMSFALGAAVVLVAAI